MRILLVNDYGTATGGAELQMLMIRQMLRQQGHDARLFTSSARINGQSNLADYTSFGTTTGFRTLAQTLNPFAYLKLRQIISNFRPEVVHIRIFLTQLSPLILLALGDIPTIQHVVWYRPICPTGTKFLPNETICNHRPGRPCIDNRCIPIQDYLPLMLQQKLYNNWRSKINLTLANSLAVKKRLTDEGYTDVDVLHNGVVSRPIRKHISDTPKVVFAGRLVREKGTDLLLRAFFKVRSNIPDTQLLIAGSGPEYAPIKSLIDKLGLRENVHLLGQISAEKEDELFEDAWVQVVPSLWEEPCSNSALEAMMRGNAVIATDIGGFTDFIEHGTNGQLVPPNDEEALVTALLSILGDKSLAIELGKNAHASISKRFNSENHINKLEQIYKNLIESDK